MPESPWLWRQTWHDLLFAHWPVPTSAIRVLVPAPLAIDEYDGTSWVGLVPFRMTGVTARGLPSVPGLSSFAEMNLRLYVTLDDRPGVWFISLDAASTLAVWAARFLVSLPYFRADMRVAEVDGAVSYRSQRRRERDVRFDASYKPDGPVHTAESGSLEHFLTERYCLYARSGRRLTRLEIHHAPWPLQPASAEFRVNTVAGAQGVALPDRPLLLHFSLRQDVIGWAPYVVSSA